MRKWIFLTLVFIGSARCTHFERSPASGYSTHFTGSSNELSRATLYRQRIPASNTTQQELIKIISELGINPNDIENPSNKLRLKRALQIRNLENLLTDDRERQQYYKNRPWFKDDVEQLEFLSQGGYYARQAWLRSKEIGKRPVAIDPIFENLIAEKDIAIGMPSELVRRSWGSPDSIDVSGNPIYGNERWKYKNYSPSPEGYRLQSKIIYFEGGKVAGWEQIDQ